MSDSTPTPFDRLAECERQMLGWTFRRTHHSVTLDELPRKLVGGDFENRVLEIARDASEEGKPLSVHLVSANLGASALDVLTGWQKRADTLDDCMDRYRAARLAYELSVVMGGTLAELASAPLVGKSVAQVAAGASLAVASILDAASSSSRTREVVGVHDLIDEHLAPPPDQVDGVVRWGCPSLDERVGSLPPETMLCLAAMNGHGKSLLGLQAARETAMGGARVLFWGIEMSFRELFVRALAAATDRSTEWLEENRTAYTANQIRELLPERLEFGRGSYDTARRHIDSAQLLEDPYDLVVFDFWQLLAQRSRDMNQAQVLEELAYSMKRDVAQRQSCAVIVMAQFNSAGKEREDGQLKMPRYEKLKGSSGMGDAANIVLALLAKEPDDDGMRSMAIEIQKHRSGGIGFIRERFWMDGARGRINEGAKPLNVRHGSSDMHAEQISF